jgi:molybdopterin molybdotransferase
MTPSSLKNPLPVTKTQQEISALITELQRLNPVQSEVVPTAELLDRVFACDIISPMNVPPHDNSAMDGYALRYADLLPGADTQLVVGKSVFAGVAESTVLAPKTAAKVMTGGVMPIGADTVVPFENATETNGSVLIPKGQLHGQNRRFKGEDLTLGRPAILSGRRCSPSDMGLIASLGIAKSLVNKRIRVAILSTGNEVVNLGESLLPGQIYDSNRYTLRALLSKLAVEVVDMGIVKDDPNALEAALKSASAQADVIISSGGVSVGEADFTRSVMSKLGTVDFCTVAMRPGRPIAIGTLDDQSASNRKILFFGLPGNPVAVMVTYYFFVQQAIKQLAGENSSHWPFMKARAATAFKKKPGRTEYQRGHVVFATEIDRTSEPTSGSKYIPVVRSTGQQGSGVLSSMSFANCLVVLHHDQATVSEGDLVDIVLFDGL